MTDLDQFIVALPKAEVHLHLEGSVDLETLRELAARHGLPPPPAGLYQFRDFPGFLTAFKTVCEYLRSPEDYELITCHLVRRLRAAGVRHAEIYFAAGVLLWQGKPLEELFDGARAGCHRSQAEAEIEVRWIFDATRQFGPEAAMHTAHHAARLRDRGVVAIGIGGDENLAPPELFREVYAYARSEGLRLTAHAGETAGPESVWGALRALEAERIGHGLSAIRDPQLVTYLAERQIPVDICLSSNIRTGALETLKQHPLRSYFDAGVLVSLSTDDPSMFATDLVREYALAHEALGFSRDELRRLAENSFRAAFAA